MSDNFRKIIVYNKLNWVYSKHIGRKGASLKLFATFLCAEWHKKRSALDAHLAEWKNERCIQCKNCIMSCPHSAIKLKIVKDEELENAPKDFKFLKTKYSQKQ